MTEKEPCCTFGASFHQTSKVMRVLVFLLFAASIAAACASEGNPPVARAEVAAAPRPSTAAANLVFQSDDSGQAWLDVSAGLPADLQIEYLYAADGEVFAGSRAGGMYSSLAPETGAWLREPVEGIFPKDEAVVGVFPGKNGPYACLSRSGFFRRTAGLWMPMHLALPDSSVNAVLETADGALLAGCRHGIYKSTDGGNFWEKVFDSPQVATLTEADGVLLASVWGSGILRSTDGGETWDWALREGGTANKIGHIAGGFTFYGMAHAVRLSTDGGLTWELMGTEGLPPREPVLNIQQVGEHLFCSHEKGIYRSTDGGKTWQIARETPTDWQLTPWGAAPVPLSFIVSGKRIFSGVLKGSGGC